MLICYFFILIYLSTLENLVDLALEFKAIFVCEPVYTAQPANKTLETLFFSPSVMRTTFTRSNNPYKWPLVLFMSLENTLLPSKVGCR